LPVAAGSVEAGAGFLPKAGLAWDLRAGAVIADCADAPTQVNTPQPQAGGVVVAAPGLRGALMGGWHPRQGGPREAVEWQAAGLQTVQRPKPLFASRRVYVLCRCVIRLLVDLCPSRIVASPPGDPPFPKQDRR